MTLRILNCHSGLALVLTLGVMLTGCATVGPDYVVPDTSWREDWDASLYDEIGVDDEHEELDLQFWWHLFDDPVLNELIELAMEASPTMKIAGLRVLETRAALGIARGYQFPQVQQIVGNSTYLGTLPDGGVWTDDIASNIGFNAGWEIDFWGKFRRSVESADAVFFSSMANQQDLQVLLSAQVADLYFSYRATALRLDIARHNAESQLRSFEITTALYESGEQAELDLQQAKTQYMSTLSQVPVFEIALRQLRNALGVILGRPPGNLPELDEEVRELPSVDPVVVKSIPAQLLLRRPDIRAAAAQVAAQTAQVGVSKSDLFPSISLFGNVGWSDSALSLGIGPALKWNIFNYGRIKNEVRVQDARLQQAIENFQIVALQAAREIDDAAISVVKTREQRDPQRESRRAAERSLELASSRYREGYADFQRVIEAQRAAAAQTDREVQVQSDHLSAIVSFYKAVGGGWQEMTIEELIPEETREAMEARTNWGDHLRDPLPPETEAPATEQPEGNGNDR